MMKCDIYRSEIIGNAYLFVPYGADPADSVPKSIITKLGKMIFLKSIEFEENSPLIAADPKEVISDIQKNGYHLQGVDIKSNEVSEAGAAIGGGILAVSLGLGPIGAIFGAALGAILASSAKGEKNDPNA